MDKVNKYAKYLFADASIAAAIEKYGFAVVDFPKGTSLVNAANDAVELLKSLSYKDKGLKFLSVGRLEDIAIRLKSTQSIRDNIVPHLSTFFKPGAVDYISGIHLIKPPSPISNLNPHQDSSLVDELLYPSVYTWLPFKNVNSFNGTLHVLPGSHKAKNIQRSLNIPWEFAPYIDVLKKYMVPVNVKFGQVVFFDSALIHSSSRNLSFSTRIAANVFIKPKAAKYLHYYSDAESEYEIAEVYNVTPDFNYQDNIMLRPDHKYTLLRTEKVVKLHLTKEKVQMLCKGWINK